jgi:hypothetical protein
MEIGFNWLSGSFYERRNEQSETLGTGNLLTG